MFINRKSRSKWTETYFVRNFRYLGGNIIHADQHRAVNIRVAVGKYFYSDFYDEQNAIFTASKLAKWP